MEVIIVGAGNVGFTVANALSRIHKITVIEKSEDKVNKIKETLDVGTYQGNGASPKILEKVITPATDMILAVTELDEINMFACMAAKTIKPNIRTVARIRNPEYIYKDKESDQYIGADHIISPELLTAEKMARIALMENAVDYDELKPMGLQIVSFLIRDRHIHLVGKYLQDIKSPQDCSIVSIYRGDEIRIIEPTLKIEPDDRINVIGTPKAIQDFNKMIGMDHEARDYVILGGGIIGRTIAEILEKDKTYIRLFEADEEKCRTLSRIFDHVLVVNADAVDPRSLKSENVGKADVLLCCTNSDEKNLLSCLIGMQLGVEKVVSRYTMRDFEEIFSMTGITSAIGYHRIVANEVFKRMVPDTQAVVLMHEEGEEFVSITVVERSKMVGVPLGDVKLPEGAHIAVIIKDDVMIFPRLDTVLEVGDKVLLYAYNTRISKLEKLFQVSIPVEP